MMKRFVRILLVALLMLLAFSAGFVVSQAEAQAKPGVEIPQNLVVVDANNKVVGTLINVIPWDEVAIVALRVLPQKRVIRLQIERDGYNNNSNPLVGFESPDCTGQAYLFYLGAPGLFDHSAIAAPGNTLYVAQSTIVPQDRFLQSIQYTPEGCVYEEFYGATVPATAVVDLDTVFTRPFDFRHSGPKK